MIWSLGFTSSFSFSDLTAFLFCRKVYCQNVGPVMMPCINDVIPVMLPCIYDVIPVMLPCIYDVIPVMIPCINDVIVTMVCLHLLLLH